MMETMCDLAEKFIKIEKEKEKEKKAELSKASDKNLLYNYNKKLLK